MVAMIAMVLLFVIAMTLVPEIVCFTALVGFLTAAVMDWMRL
jgi:hypothetical protein